MRAIALALLIAASGIGPSLHQCMGAQLAVVHAASAKLQDNGERRTPKDVVCARVARKGKAEACSCHAHNCRADPADPNSYSAHTDKACLNNCLIEKCTCSTDDCP